MYVVDVEGVVDGKYVTLNMELESSFVEAFSVFFYMWSYLSLPLYSRSNKIVQLDEIATSYQVMRCKRECLVWEDGITMHRHVSLLSESNDILR